MAASSSGEEFNGKNETLKIERENLIEENQVENNLNISFKQKIEKRHKCEQCGKKFPYFSILEAHKRCHTGEKPFQCKYCDKSFAQKATLQVHERTHTGERPYKCKFCEKTFAQYGTKTVHEKSAHLGIRNYICPYCDKNLSSPSALYTHKKTHGEKAFKCPGCTKTFTLKNYLKLHIRQVHEQTERKHTCRYCAKSFAYAGSLQVHLRTHTGERPFRCKFCPKSFASQGNLQSHERTHTGERPYLCIECGRSFIQKSQVTAHESTHASRRSSSSGSSPSIVRKTGWCDDKCIEESSSHVLHVLQPLKIKSEDSSSHSSELSTKIAPSSSLIEENFCSSSSSTSSNFFIKNNNTSSTPPTMVTTNFNEIAHCASAPPQPTIFSTTNNNNNTTTNVTHRKQSFGGGDFVCKFCGKHYAYASSLYVHTRLHTGERPFRCNYCDKAFTNQGNMQVHLRVHTGERPFKCDGCGKSYAQNIGLKIHQEQCQPWLNCHSNGINVNYVEEQRDKYNNSSSSSHLNGKSEPLLINTTTSDEYCSNSTTYPIYAQPINSIQQQSSLFQTQNGEQQINDASLLLEQQQIHAIRALLDLSSSTSHQQININNNTILQQLPSSTILPLSLNSSPFIKTTPQNNQEILLNNTNMIQQNQSIALHQQIIQQLLAAPVPIEQSLPLVQQFLHQFGPLEEAKLSEAIAAVLVGPSTSTSSQYCNI